MRCVASSVWVIAASVQVIAAFARAVAGGVWDIASSMRDFEGAVWAVASSMWAVTSEDRERRYYFMWCLSRDYKCSAHMSLVNHSGTCGSEVQPPLEPTCNNRREQRQGTKTDNQEEETIQ